MRFAWQFLGVLAVFAALFFACELAIVYIMVDQALEKAIP